jgi:hypothetical protein
MNRIIQIVFLLGGLTFVGCGGGESTSPEGSGSTELPHLSGDEPVNNNEEMVNGMYENSHLPSLNNDTIPEALLRKKSELRYHKMYQKLPEKGNGLQLFQESLGYFYFKQMEMNMNLSYLDSVWKQIEMYCKEKTSCSIPKDIIEFTYTEALYNHDVQLIEIYEAKSGDLESFRDIKGVLKNRVGEMTKLGEAKLLTLSASSYDYELKVDISNVTLDNDELITITKWSRNHSVYQIREELFNGYNFDQGICRDRESGVIYTEYDYNKSSQRIDNLYTYGYDVICKSETETNKSSTFLQKHNHEIQLLELMDKIKLKEHISDRIADENYNVPLNYYLEGELTEEGGYVLASDNEGFYNNEKFDTEGNIVSNISCIGDKGNNLDDCTIKGEALIKSIVTENVYKVGWLYVSPSFNTLAEHSAVTFNEDNTLEALINCSIFKADYRLDNSGILFSHIQEESNTSLLCLDGSFAESFRIFLKNGHEFNDEGYVVWNGLIADLDVVEKKSKFDRNVFMANLTENRYVDSYTMSNLFKVTSWDGIFLNPMSNENYLLHSTPSMHVQNEKIYIDLIDANFEADIHVINNDLLRFSNIVKTDKKEVVYPTRTCSNEAGANECLDGDERLNYQDKLFRDVIQEFLNNDVQVSNSGVVDNGMLWMHNDKLSFIAIYE